MDVLGGELFHALSVLNIGSSLDIDIYFDLVSIVIGSLAIYFSYKLYVTHRRDRLSRGYSMFIAAVVSYIFAELMEFLHQVGFGLLFGVMHASFETLALFIIFRGLYILDSEWGRLEEPLKDKDALLGFFVRLPDYIDLMRNRLRLKILTSIYEHTELSYTALLRMLNINKGLLNFHLRKLRKKIYWRPPREEPTCYQRRAGPCMGP